MTVDLLCLSMSPIFHVATHACPLQDGVLAAAVFAEMAADLKVWGLTVRQQLESLREAYGFFEFRTGDLNFYAASFGLGRGVTLNPCCPAGYFVAESPEVTASVFANLREGGHYAKVGPAFIPFLLGLAVQWKLFAQLGLAAWAAGCGWHRSVFRARPGHWN